MSAAVPTPNRYKTTNWGQYNAALKARGSLTLWFDADMQWLAAPSCKRGRQHTFSDACIQFCLSIKCLFGLPLRQTLGLVQSLLQLSGAHWPVPDYSTVSRRQKSLNVQLKYQGNSHHPATQERRALEKGEISGSEGAQRSSEDLPTPGLGVMEEVERLPPAQPGGDQDALLQAVGRAGDGAHV